MSSCINRRKLVPERLDRGGTLRYAWLRAPPLPPVPQNYIQTPTEMLDAESPHMRVGGEDWVRSGECVERAAVDSTH